MNYSEVPYFYEKGAYYNMKPYFLKAELDAGKTYYVMVKLGRGGAWLIPINRSSEYWDKVYDYEKSINRIAPDHDLLKAWEDNNMYFIQGYVMSGYEKKWNKMEWPKLLPEDGR